MNWFNDVWRRHPRLAAIRHKYLPPTNFITVHYLYFITVCFIASGIFYAFSTPANSIAYVDCLFLVISAMTEAGLNTVNLSQMATVQQVILWLLIILGSSIWVSIWTVLIRKREFEQRFRDVARRATLRSRSTVDYRLSMVDIPLARRIRSFSRTKSISTSDAAANDPIPIRNGSPGSKTVPPISGPVSVQKLREPVPGPEKAYMDSFEPTSRAAESNDEIARDRVAFAESEERSPHATTTSTDIVTGLSRRHVPTMKDNDLEAGPLQHEISHRQFLTAKKVGRNAQFHDLTASEREHLGGTEYCALKVLSVAVPVYFFAWQIFGCIGLGAWIAINQPQPALDNGINPWWNGIFNGASAFNNSGMSVLDANMIPYGSSYFVLIVMGAMILAGNTAYPVFLRFWLWGILKLLNLLTYESSYQNLKETLEYILKYPRRVYTNLFPSRATWWLLFMLFVLNGTDWVAFEVLNFGNPKLEYISPGSRTIDGLFQAIAVRSGGFYVVTIPDLYIGLQVLYVIMMYISVYPVVITMRHSNVYEERSLGIYNDDVQESSSSSNTSPPGAHNRDAGALAVMGRLFRDALGRWDGVGAAPQAAHGSSPESRSSFIGHQVRGQLSHDLWLLVLAVLAISTIETLHFLEAPSTYSVFNIIFEVVSAYGCVGISVGVPFGAFSFSGGLYPGSKLVLCFVMIRGRHRGLPVALDRAVRLPGNEMGRTEEEDHQIRRTMSMRQPSVDPGKNIAE